MSVIEWVRVEVSDIKPDGTPRHYSQMWEKALCEVRGGEVINTHTGKRARLLDGCEGKAGK